MTPSTVAAATINNQISLDAVYLNTPIENGEKTLERWQREIEIGVGMMSKGLQLVGGDKPNAPTTTGLPTTTAQNQKVERVPIPAESQSASFEHAAPNGDGDITASSFRAMAIESAKSTMCAYRVAGACIGLVDIPIRSYLIVKGLIHS